MVGDSGRLHHGDAHRLDATGPANHGSAKLDNVLFTSEGVGLAGASLSYWTNKAEVHCLLVRFARSSAHPILQVALGGVLGIIGLIPLCHLMLWFRFGGAI